MVSVKDRATQLVSAKVVTSVDKETLNELVDQRTHESATVYTDGSTAYKGCKDHEHVRRSVEVRTWASPHERRRELLGLIDARLLRRIPSDIYETHAPPCREVCWSA